MRHAAQRVGVGTVLRFDVSARVDIGRRAEALGNGRQCYPFREQLTVAVVEGVHWSPLKVLVRLRFGLFVRGFGVIRQIQRAFLATSCNKTSDRDKRSKRRDQALHGEILCKALIAPEYTDHPAPCLCERRPVWRAFGAKAAAELWLIGIKVLVHRQ